MTLASGRVFWGLILPAILLLLLAWSRVRALDARVASLASEGAELRAGLARDGIEPDASASHARRDQALAEAARLRAHAALSHRLAEDPLLRENASRPFTLIAFERERALVADSLGARAREAGLALHASVFGILSDPALVPAAPRRRWAQLALAREIVERAVAARLSSCEALPLPAPREIRADQNGPLLADEIRFAVRVSGPSARVEHFLELLALGAAPDDPPLHLDQILLRKEGTSLPDQASATVAVAALLPP